jgi:osmotically-inducible protein OsmY
MKIFWLSLVWLLSLLALAGCSTVLPPSEDYAKRSFGTVWDDQMTESRALRLIRDADSEFKDAHINVTCFDSVVLITGQVSSDDLKKTAADTVAGLKHAKTVHNELQVAGPTSLVARTNDSWLTTKVKTSMFIDDKIEGSRIKVVTEDGIVYLMGLLTRNERDLAVDRARQVYGVQKIVKVFEYLN